MKKSKKIWIATAIGLVVLGALISVCALAVTGFNFKLLSTDNYKQNTYTVNEAFSNIKIGEISSNVYFEPSENGECYVLCNETDKMSHTVEVENETLTIKSQDLRKWYDLIGITFGETDEVTVYLPQNAYDTLHLEAVSGDIRISKNFSFTESQIVTISGDISFSANTENALTLQTVSGNIELNSIKAENITAKTTSGDIELSNVIAADNIELKSVSGNVDLDESDANTLWIKTTSGDVEGELLTSKIFITDTTSGDINVPRSATGGNCEVTTTSGNIEFEISGD